jgi:hypothetical protein
MHIFDQRKARDVAHDAKALFTTLDTALLSSAQLMMSVLKGKEGAGLPERQSQRLLLAVHESTGNMLAGREKMVLATRLLTQIQKRSNQAETDFGCPGPGPWSQSAATPVTLAAA